MTVDVAALVGGGYEAFWGFRGRYRVVKGGRASKKSKTAALNFIVRMMKYRDANLLVVRKVYRTLKDSCFAELRWAVRRLGVEAFWEFRESPLEMVYRPTGQKILFRGLDDAMKITSITVNRGFLCWLWVEEAYELASEEEFQLLDESIRGFVPPPLFKQVTLTFNPWHHRHWLKTRFFDGDCAGAFRSQTGAPADLCADAERRSRRSEGRSLALSETREAVIDGDCGVGDAVLCVPGVADDCGVGADSISAHGAVGDGQNTRPCGATLFSKEGGGDGCGGASGTPRPTVGADLVSALGDGGRPAGDVLAMTTTYLCNEFIDAADLRVFEALKVRDPARYLVAGLGEWGHTDSLVFGNVRLESVEVSDVERVYYGLDWGYYPDPTAFVACGYDAAARRLVVFDEWTAVRASAWDVFEALRGKGLTGEDVIVCDSSDKRSIADLRAYGLGRAMAASKGPGSVRYSMKWLQALDCIVIDPVRCPRAAAEFCGYEYARDAAGEVVDGYVDGGNHCIDAVRYAMNGVWREGGR